MRDDGKSIRRTFVTRGLVGACCVAKIAEGANSSWLAQPLCANLPRKNERSKRAAALIGETRARDPQVKFDSPHSRFAEWKTQSGGNMTFRVESAFFITILRRTQSQRSFILDIIYSISLTVSGDVYAKTWKIKKVYFRSFYPEVLPGRGRK